MGAAAGCRCGRGRGSSGTAAPALPSERLRTGEERRGEEGREEEWKRETEINGENVLALGELR